MDNKSDDQFLIIEATIGSRKQDYDKNHNETAKKITLLTEHHNENIDTLKQILSEMKKYKNNISKSSTDQKDTSTSPDPTTTVQTNRRPPPLEGVISENIGVMWTLKHDISSPKFYELLIKT